MKLGYRCENERVIHEVIDDEAIMINLNSGNYYTLNDSGAFLWLAMQRAADVQALAAQAAAHFAVAAEEIEPQVLAFLQHLMREGLVVREPAEAAANAPEFRHAAWGPPELTVFSDMQELLILDPIHEISEKGWPYTAEDMQKPSAG